MIMLVFDKTSNKKKYLIIIVAALYLFFSCFYVLLCHRNLANTNLFSSGNSVSQNVHFVNKPINSSSSITLCSLTQDGNRFTSGEDQLVPLILTEFLHGLRGALQVLVQQAAQYHAAGCIRQVNQQVTQQIINRHLLHNLVKRMT